MTLLSRLPDSIASRLTLPLMAAPMFRVSGPELVIATCRAGVIGTFPTANCRTVTELDVWLNQIKSALTPRDAPFAVNLIIKRDALQEELACLVRHQVEMVIASVGSPVAVVGPLHDIGCKVFCDVASLKHARKAVEAGVDGLILLTAGAGGQTGWVNGFSFVRAVREFYDGPMILSGGISDGTTLFAAQVLGCDLGYMGTKFIATHESMAVQEYKKMLVDSELDDVLLSRAFTGLQTNTLVPSIVAAGLDPANLPTDMTRERADALYGSLGSGEVKRWRDIWSAGHTVSGVKNVVSVSELIESILTQYQAAVGQVQKQRYL